MLTLTHEEEVALHNYATEIQNLDPIGAGDVIRDLFNFARLYVAEGGHGDAETVWVAFTKSPVYLSYGF